MSTESCVENMKRRDRTEPRHRWEDNIRIDLREWVAKLCGQDAPGSEYGPVAGSCEHGNEPSG